MSKHQNCVGCSCDFVGPDANIGLNLCEDCEEDMHGPCREELAKAVAEIERLREAFAALLDVANDLRCYTYDWNWKYGDYWDKAIEAAEEQTDE